MPFPSTRSAFEKEGTKKKEPCKTRANDFYISVFLTFACFTSSAKLILNPDLFLSSSKITLVI